MSVPRLAVSVDLVVLTVREQRLSALMWRRDRAPYDGAWSLPGGFIQLDEDLPAAASRLMAERAGLADVRIHLEQLATYGYPDRDPRQRVRSDHAREGWHHASVTSTTTAIAVSPAAQP